MKPTCDMEGLCPPQRSRLLNGLTSNPNPMPTPRHNPNPIPTPTLTPALNQDSSPSSPSPMYAPPIGI